MALQSNYRAYYESPERPEYLSPRERERIFSIIENIPRDIDTMLELGCGDGRIASRLKAPMVVGTDLSLKSLQTCPNLFQRVQADARQLPFMDHSFDLVLCSEVLEHLPTELFDLALREMVRLAKQYVLITVPNRENLREGSMRCPECGRHCHTYGHVRRFDDAAFRSLLPGFEMTAVWKCGAMSRWLPPLLWLRRLPTGGARCLYCNAESPTQEMAFDQRVLHWAHTNLVAPWHRRPYWMAGLFQRQ